ncbi:haloacid dehalogenase-like hydrolase [Candidatus Contendibacter odensensis]|uniref:Haloacid dehalogenase n=1 Tax=Candidatus Contendobacter odensis Run_B_J11 TaxID=1400861 RepID=A0A7U7J5X8_9GAMM|nr:haloacid dehalogenase-like hydrolase [Candidatus Contendobacter odensis]MBK8752889.1 haloacid dehalogenase-like hydrolase [Candidatus Competibacteraceae bacterium]CDH47033.1 hypothetical protein BN874_70017 [Candidatus Contendobacter odensis Run_B_J11]
MDLSIRLFDVDGTITMPGVDIWHLVTRNFAVSPAEFDNAVADWKAGMKQGSCPYTESKKMMKKGLQLMKSGVGDKEVQEEAEKVTLSILHMVFPGAIEYVKRSIHCGFRVVFATTNYDTGGKGFISALKRAGMLNAGEADAIAVSGSVINWKDREVLHFNMDRGKVRGICEVLGVSQDALGDMIDSSYGDDPSGNDREILRIAPKAYVIRNNKNKHLQLPSNMQLTDWDFINAQTSALGS